MARDSRLKLFSSVPLVTNWSFKQGSLTSTNGYVAAHNLPTEIFSDLTLHQRIPDHFKDFNELSVRWVGEETWTYRTSFAAPAQHSAENARTVIRFEGLDTFASVYLNGELIVQSDNMFHEHRVDVTGQLELDENILEIVFESAQKKGEELIKDHPEHRFIVHQTEISRGPVRKAQYHWGWDWGPVLMTCGPWKPIFLETYRCRLSDLWVQYDLSADLKSAMVRISAQCEGIRDGVTFRIVKHDTKDKVAETHVNVASVMGTAKLEATFDLDNLALWWPRGYGEQALYIIEASTHPGSTSSGPGHTISQTIGFRKVELIQEQDTHGISFYFRINNTDIFCGGSCWIPADSFLTRTTTDQYRAWMQLAAAGNQIMIRVWGGGIYEPNAFYSAADEFGLLVWQDFAFACANYPAYPAYLASVEKEARQNVGRLRNHPSLVIWAGNNEDYQIVERYGLQYDVEDKDPRSWLKTDFPARYIYEHLLPKIIHEESPHALYHPSSPFGNGESTVLKVDPTIGDVHQWNVWHGTMEPYQRFPDMGGRFVSEFGMEAYPHVSTLERCITREEDRYVGSMAMDFRNKAIGHERRLLSYVAENFKLKQAFAGFAHLTQVMQADAMAWAYKSWRRQWGRPGDRKCGGALVWQLNDCWPTVSWAVVDYYMVPKSAYYAIKRAMAPVTVCVQRKFKSWSMRPADELWQRDTGHIDMLKRWQDTEYEVWAANSTLEELRGNVVVRFISVKTGEECLNSMKLEVNLIANGTTELLQDSLSANEEGSPIAPHGVDKPEPFVIYVSLYINDQRIASDIAWPDPIKYLSFDDRGVDVRYSDDKQRISISAKRPVKGLVFDEKEGIILSDNGLDLVPGQTEEVLVSGCGANELKWRYIDV